MATVYRATHLKMGEEVAVKVLNPEMVGKERIVDRFRNEARAALRINHPNAIKVTDYDVTEDNLYYLVMEIVEGQLLSDLISEEKLNYRRAVRLLCQVCEAIDAAHKQGIIHRDLKPNNIIVQNMEGRETVKVLDFGVARLREPDHTDPRMRVLTKAGTVMGTPQYMSPEQYRGENLGESADVYSLGVIAYEMLTQRPPFIPTDDGREFFTQLQTETPPLCRQFAPDVPASIERVVLRALEKDPANRQPSANALASELRRAVKKAVGGTEDPVFSQSTVIDERGRPTGAIEQKADPLSREDPVVMGRAEPRKYPAPDRKRGKLRALWIAVAAAGVAGIALYFTFFGKRAITDDGRPATISDEFGEMALVRGGKFIMGRNDGDEDERPEREVEVKNFYLDKYEVTNQQYKKFVDATGHRAPGNWKDNLEAQSPVTHVTWTDAYAYAKWARKRLPTEAEWEYAARGGARDFLYPWGNEWREGYANAGIDASKPVSVRGFENDRSIFGIQGLAGNVSEWVDSVYLPYMPGQASGCPECRVYRGGNFKSKVKESAATHRLSDYPELPASASDRAAYKELVFPRVGFRCAK